MLESSFSPPSSHRRTLFITLRNYFTHMIQFFRTFISIRLYSFDMKFPDFRFQLFRRKLTFFRRNFIEIVEILVNIIIT